jgi:hypothetical protein
MNFLDAVKPETFITLTGISIILLYLIVGNFRGWYIPGPTHRREVAALEARVAQAILDRDEQVKAIRDEMTMRMDNFRADHALRMEQSVKEHDKQLAALIMAAEGIRADRDVMLAAKQRDADDWRAAYHIGAENAKASEDRMDEVLETVRLTYGLMNAMRTVTGGREPQLPAGERH